MVAMNFQKVPASSSPCQGCPELGLHPFQKCEPHLSNFLLHLFFISRPGLCVTTWCACSHLGIREAYWVCQLNEILQFIKHRLP